MFPVHSPKIERSVLASRGDVRRAKLYYLRDRVGKRARVRERRYVGPEETIEPGLRHEAVEGTDAEGMTAEEAVIEKARLAAGGDASPEGDGSKQADSPGELESSAAAESSAEPEPG